MSNEIQESKLPRHVVIAEDIVRRINKGEFNTGFPSVQFFVEDYQASSKTISKVWGKLKADGIIETKPGAGTYIKKEAMLHQGHKRCVKCKKEKLLTDYYKHFSSGKWYYRACCKKCVIKENIKYRKKRSN